MNALAWILATSTAAAGVDYGWQPSPAGDLEYVIQIEPAVMDALRSGEEITSEIPPELAGVRKFRIRVGTGPVPRIPLNHPKIGRTALPTNHAAAVAASAASNRALNRQPGPLDGLPPPPNMAAGAGSSPSHLRTTPNPFGPRSATGQPGQTPDATRQWDPRSPVATLTNGQPTGANAAPDDRTGGYRNPDISKFSDRYRTQPPGAAESRLVDPRTSTPAGQTLPPRPPENGASASIRSNGLPPTPDMSSRYRQPVEGGYRAPSPASAGATARNAPQPGYPGFGPSNQVPSATVTRDSRPVDSAGLAMPRPLKNASFDQPAGGTVHTGAFQMDKPTLPEELAQQPYKPWGWFIAILFGFLISVSANFYLGWIAWDLHRRYRSAVLQMTDAAALGV